MSNEKQYPAVCEVHWPTGPVLCWDTHARKLVGVGGVLGYHIARIEGVDEGAQCTNCVNEANKEQGNET